MAMETRVTDLLQKSKSGNEDAHTKIVQCVWKVPREATLKE